MLSCAIDSKEWRYTVVADIPGAFLHADMDEDVHMILEGNYCRVNRQTRAQPIQETHMVHTTRRADAICTIKKSTIWHSTSSSVVLEAIVRHITGVGFRN